MFDKFHTPIKRSAASAKQASSDSPADHSDILDFMPKIGSAMMASSSGVIRRHRPSNMSLDLTSLRDRSRTQYDEGYATSRSTTPTPDSVIFGNIQDTPKTSSDASSTTIILTPTSDTSAISKKNLSATLKWLTDIRTIASFVLFFVAYFLPGIIFSADTPQRGLLRVFASFVEIIMYAFGYSIGWVVKHVAWGFHDACSGWR